MILTYEYNQNFLIMIMKELSTGTISQDKYKESPYRYLIVLLFALPSFCNGMCWVVISPISTVIEEVYQIDRWIVTLIPMLYMIMYIIVNFFSNWVLDTKGIRVGVLIGTLLTAVGAFFRCFINTSFSFVVFGQMLCATGQPFILNAPAKISTFWFNKQNRPLATAVLSIVNILGNGFGFAMSSIFVDGDATDPSSVKRETEDLMKVEALMCVVSAVLVAFLFREKPKHPPSIGAEIQKMPFKQSLKVLFTSENFLALLVGFSLINGTFSYFGAAINFILVPFNYTDNQISLFGGLAVFIGIVGACIICPIAQKSAKYKFILILCSLVASFSLFLHAFFLYFGNLLVFAMLTLLLVGFTITPQIPISFDLACEMEFPVGEAQVTGVLMTGAQIVAIIQTIVMQTITGDNAQSTIFVQLVLLSGMCMCGTACMTLMNPKLKRRIKESEQKKIVSTSSSTVRFSV